MLKLRDEQWERIREHFPEENVPDTPAGRTPISTRRVLARPRPRNRDHLGDLRPALLVIAPMHAGAALGSRILFASHFWRRKRDGRQPERRSFLTRPALGHEPLSKAEGED